MRLTLASDAEKVARDRLTASAWGRHLTLEQFLAREAALRSHPFAAASMRTWLWRDADGAVLSSCETFQVPCRRRGALGHGVIVASVFTEPARRGRGHAGAMLEAVCQHERETGAAVAALFSEVGPELYERVGFGAQPSFDVVFPARTASRECVSFGREVTAPEPGDGPLELTWAQCDWHVERERFYSRALARPAPGTHTASFGEARCAFAASFQTNELHVLWYRCSSDDEARALIHGLQHVAHACHLDAVRFWETTPLPTAGGRRVERLDEVPMLRALDGGASSWPEIHRGLWA